MNENPRDHEIDDLVIEVDELMDPVSEVTVQMKGFASDVAKGLGIDQCHRDELAGNVQFAIHALEEAFALICNSSGDEEGAFE